MPRATASALKILPHCGYSMRDDIPTRDDKPTREQRVGSAVHSLNEWVTNGLERTIEDAFAMHNVTPKCKAIVEGCHRGWLKWWESYGCPAFNTEVAYEFNVLDCTARELVLPGPRQYPYEDWCIYGTADAVLYGATNGVWVTDYKTGNPVFYDKAHENAQMLFLCMCAAKVSGVATATSTLLFLDENMPAAENSAQVSAATLAAFEAELCSNYGGIETTPPRIGDHCRDMFCKLRPTKKYEGCPAWLAQGY